MKSTAYAHGKVILFGEHAVTYGHPALAAAINRQVEVSVEPNAKDIIVSEQFGTVTLQEELTQDGWYSPLQYVLHKFRLKAPSVNNFKISIKSDLPKGCGSGSATACALTKALYQSAMEDLDLEKLIGYVTEADILSHGHCSSGLDAFAVSRDRYTFLDEGNFSHIKSFPELKMIVCDSGVPAKTKDQLEKIEKLRKEDPSRFEVYMGAIEVYTNIGFTSLAKNNLQEFGRSMYENHDLLKQLGLSCPELDEIVQIAKRNMAYGAKMTGAGGGGAAIIFPGPGSLDRFALELTLKGYKSHLVTVGFEENSNNKNSR